ncbi:MAG: glycosyltransferase family 2 protein, partial [Gammaproteobacteria bacterium]
PDAEIIVVNDGSTDDTGEICRQYEIPQVSHPYSMGNGAAIKSGVRAATGDIIVFMDADGQHDVHDIKRMIDKLNQGYEMVVGARTFDSHASLARRYANLVYNKLASFMTGYKIEDLTSGFRVAKRDKFIKFLYLLPNGFSYPTTSTMAFFRSALPVGYVDIQAGDRKGKSHIRLFKDGLRFFIIIVKIGALFSPMRLFLPISAVLFMLGVSYYIYTYTVYDRFTNMSALIILASLFIFLMGIMAEFLSSLHYKEIQEDDNK